MPQELTTILSGINTIAGWVILAVILIALHKAGVLTELLSFLKKKNGNGEKIKEDILENLETNHLHGINDRLDKLIEQNTEILLIVRKLDK